MRARARPLERLTASDMFLLLWDDYDWSTDIGGLAVLDGTGLLDRDGRIRIEEVRGKLEPRLHQIPRFRQLLFRPRCARSSLDIGSIQPDPCGSCGSCPACQTIRWARTSGYITPSPTAPRR